MWHDGLPDRAPEAIHRVFRPMHLPPDRSTAQGAQLRWSQNSSIYSQPSPTPSAAPSSPTLQPATQRRHTVSDSAPPPLWGSSIRTGNTSGAPDAAASLDELPPSPSISWGRQARQAEAPMEAPCLGSPRVLRPSRTFSIGEAGLGRQDSLTMDWLQADSTLVQSPTKQRQPARKSSLMPAPEAIDFPMLPQHSPEGSMEPAPIIVPGEPGPASSRAVQVSLGGGEGLASAEVAGGAEELEFSDQSSVDMPFDISLNSTMILDGSFSGFDLDAISRRDTPTLSYDVVVDTPISFDPAASPLAREPPLAQVAPLWQEAAPRVSGIEQRLRMVKCTQPGVEQQLIALQLENRLLKQQLADLLSRANRRPSE
eukprot:jgi/Tetstr1/453848/TSEL_004009.t1